MPRKSAPPPRTAGWRTACRSRSCNWSSRKAITRKLLRVIVPLGMQLRPGTRLIIDQGQPATAPFSICFPVGCMADYEVNADTIAQMKKGQMLTIQAINMQGSAISLPLPLADFAKAYDGPPTDPKVFEEQQRKLQEELQKKAEEARKKLESQNQAPATQIPAAALRHRRRRRRRSNARSGNKKGAASRAAPFSLPARGDQFIWLLRGR